MGCNSPLTNTLARSFRKRSYLLRYGLALPRPPLEGDGPIGSGGVCEEDVKRLWDGAQKDRLQTQAVVMLWEWWR